jgi:hypothetical protein
MFKKMLIVSILFLSIVAFSNLTWATSCISPDGGYDLDGKMTAKVSAPGIVTLSITFPDLENIGGVFYFEELGSFHFFLPLLSTSSLLTGTWDMTQFCSTKFKVESDLESLLSNLSSELPSEFSEYDISVEVTRSSFTGTIQSNGNIKGKFSLTITIYVDGYNYGTLSLSGSFTGEPNPAYSLSTLSSSPLSLPQEKGFSPKSTILKDLILKLIKVMPAKGALPIK